MKKNTSDRCGGGGARAFIQQAKRNNSSKPSSVFNPESDKVDLSDNLVKIARKSGILNLANRNLQKIPSKVWRIHVIDDQEKSSSSVALDNPSDEKWWEFVDLRKLIIANNCIKCIPGEINQLSSLQTLDAHDNQITLVADEIGELRELQKLDISHNQLRDLPVQVYNLKQLIELKLNNNNLETMSEEIRQLALLKQLDISFNNIMTLPDDLGFLSSLVSLNISNNKLTEIPHDFGGLTGLRELDASDNTLTHAPSSFSELIHLEILLLQNNKFEEIPSVFGCVRLRELYFGKNLLKDFSSEKFVNSRIELLDFRNNKIQSLIVNEEDMEFLDRFYLDNNNISLLPNGLALLPSLKHLSLEGNPLRGIRLDILKRGTLCLLKYLRSRLNSSVSEKDYLDSNPASKDSSPREISSQEQLGIDIYKLRTTKTLSLISRQIKSIEEQVFVTAMEAKVNKIDLSKNILTHLPTTFECMSHSLCELNLDFNRFTSLPFSIGTFVNLQFLSFQNNLVDELPAEFSALTKLREINFGYNKFTCIPACIYDISSLEILIAANNKISQLEVSNLERLRRLAVLDLRNNDISHVPPQLGLLTHLRSLNIEGNAFRVPGYAVLSKGTETILSFLRNRIQK